MKYPGGIPVNDGPKVDRRDGLLCFNSMEKPLVFYEPSMIYVQETILFPLNKVEIDESSRSMDPWPG